MAEKKKPIHIASSLINTLTLWAEGWGCSLGGAAERIINVGLSRMRAVNKYRKAVRREKAAGVKGSK